MAVRHAARFVQASMEAMLTTFLAEYGWTTLTPPFGAKPVTLYSRQPKESELAPTETNSVFISFGDETSMSERQLGGGLLQVEHVLFVDILAENRGVGLAIASDVKDRLEGLFGGSRYLYPVNPGTGQRLPGYVGEFGDTVREQPRADLETWTAVKSTLYLDFPGEAT